jgi:hypothetical protein
LMVGTTFAQAPTKPAKPARPAMPAVPAQPVQSADRAPTDDEELCARCDGRPDGAVSGARCRSSRRCSPARKPHWSNSGRCSY